MVKYIIIIIIKVPIVRKDRKKIRVPIYAMSVFSYIILKKFLLYLIG